MADGKGKTVPGNRANARKGALSLELLVSARNSESSIDDEERRDQKRTMVSTIECLLQVNKNKLTKKTDREG